MESGLSGLQFSGQMTFSNCYAIKKTSKFKGKKGVFSVENPLLRKIHAKVSIFCKQSAITTSMPHFFALAQNTATVVWLLLLVGS